MRLPFVMRCAGVVVSGLLLIGQTYCAEKAAPAGHAKLVTDETEQAVERGLVFLADRQLEDGSFGTSGFSRNVAVCALGGMAFLAQGSTPERGPYAEQISRSIDYLLSQTTEDGFIIAEEASTRPMYGHGFAALFLCESYGMAKQPELRDRLADAIRLIVRTQNAEGGWRYQPKPAGADLSVTVCQVMALRAARNAGIAVPTETIDRSVDYVKKCQNADGGFRYLLAGDGQSGSQFARSAAAVVAFYNAGIYDGPELERGLDYLTRFTPGNNQPGRDTFYFYGQYYAAQAMWHAGGQRWQKWYPAVRDEMLAKQRANGSWTNSICAEYGTAMACIVLQVPNNYLPILQR